MERQSHPNPLVRVMSLRDFRLLFAGSATSLLGDQFALIATPWLVLQMTGDPLALGIVLALEGIPRAAFMLVGGAITDRLSPRLVMLSADVIRLVLTALMALAVFTDGIQMWMVYAFSLSFGLVAGFAVPAQNSIVPMLVREEDLQGGNSAIMGVTQLAGFVGPTIAGVVIGAYADSLFGIGLAMGIDAATFAISAVCLWLLRGGGRSKVTSAAGAAAGLWREIGDGIRYLWADGILRLMFLILAAVNFLLIGPLLVGIPVLADQRLPEGAVAFGLLMSAFAGGNLIGFLLAGSLPRPSGTLMKAILIAVLAAFAVVVGLLGSIPSTWVDFGLLAVLGLGNGYLAIILFTWFQTRTPKDMLGRMMSILVFASAGLIPVSQALAGAVSKWDLDLMFAMAGGLALLATLWAALQPGLQAFSDSLAGSPPAEKQGAVSTMGGVVPHAPRPLCQYPETNPD
jgi:MFS family permease